MCFLRLLECPGSVIKRLPGEFVRRKVVLFAVMLGSNAVRVGSLFVHFGGYSMGVTRHTEPAYTRSLAELFEIDC